MSLNEKLPAERIDDMEIRAGQILRKRDERAAEDDTEQPITGELHGWVKVHTRDGENFVIWGNIYNDIHGRFPDGYWIRTSLIARIEGDIAVTLNSNYRLIGEEMKAG